MNDRSKNNLNNDLLKRGFGLLEIVVGVSIISLSLFGLVAALQMALKASYENTSRMQAGFLLEEGAEAVRSMRDAGWSANIASLGTEVPIHLDFNGSAWTATTSDIFIDNVFERKFYLYDVYRDANDDIAPAGTPDSGTKKVTVMVSWRARSGTTTEQATMYLANIFDN